MLEIIMLAALAACGVLPTSATNEPPDEYEPAEPVKPLDQHFCCQSVDPKTLTGGGCTAISDSLELINACTYLLYCPGAYTKDNGKVTCVLS